MGVSPRSCTGAPSSRGNYLEQSAKRHCGGRALSLDDSARLLALANSAMADAGITAWDTSLNTPSGGR